MSEIKEARFRSPDGLELVADVGGAPFKGVVVLMHGGGQTRHSWAGAMRMLIANGYRVINYDSRGHGDSEWPPSGDYSWKRRSADLAAILADTSGPVALVGASMGGVTALYAAATGAVRVSALVMVDIVPRPAVDGVGRIRAFMQGNPQGFASLDEAAEAVVAYNPSRPRPKDSTGLAKNLRRRDDGRLYWHWDPRILGDGAKRDALADELLAWCAAVTAPTLLVRGLASDVVTDEGIAEFRRHLPDLEVRDVAGAGHMVAGDRNDAFNAAAVDFLARHMPRAAGGP